MTTFNTPEFRRRAFLAGLGALSTSALVTACGGTTASTGAGSTTPVDGGNITFLIQGYDTGWVSSKTSISSYEATCGARSRTSWCTSMKRAS